MHKKIFALCILILLITACGGPRSYRSPSESQNPDTHGLERQPGDVLEEEQTGERDLGKGADKEPIDSDPANERDLGKGADKEPTPNKP